MNLKRKCQVVMLPTNEDIGSIFEIPIIKWHNANLLQSPLKQFNNNGLWLGQHLYILSDEKIEEGDWFYYPKSYKNIGLCNLRDYKYLSDKNNNNWLAESCKKVIASTDKSLNLPEPSPEFIKKYIETYNSGNPIVECMVEYEEYWVNLLGIGEEKRCRLKTNKSNQISITKVKDSWSRDEIGQILTDFLSDCWNKNYQFNGLAHDEVANNWILENL